MARDGPIKYYAFDQARVQTAGDGWMGPRWVVVTRKGESVSTCKWVGGDFPDKY